MQVSKVNAMLQTNHKKGHGSSPTWTSEYEFDSNLYSLSTDL